MHDLVSMAHKFLAATIQRKGLIIINNNKKEAFPLVGIG